MGTSAELRRNFDLIIGSVDTTSLVYSFLECAIPPFVLCSIPLVSFRLGQISLFAFSVQLRAGLEELTLQEILQRSMRV